MALTRWAVGFTAVFVAALSARAADFGENIVEAKLTLPNGDTYMRGASDPVAGLVAEITLTNKTQKESFAAVSETVPTVSRLTDEEYANIEKMTDDERKAVLEKHRGTTVKVSTPANIQSLGYAYIEPELGPVDNVSFVITKLPDEGEVVAEGAPPKIIPRDEPPDHVSRADSFRTKYLAAGETSPAYDLAVGKYYLIGEPGMYSIKAVLRSIPDSSAPKKVLETNEEKFRVLPFKVIGQKIEEVQNNLALYERGTPAWNYMVYQLHGDGAWDEVWYAQRMNVRGIDRVEWHRLCTVKTGTVAQIAQVAPKKVAILSAQAKGDAGLYTVEFDAFGAKVTPQAVALKEGAAPKLKVEGGTVSVE